jgi:hypothetical protein
VVGSSRPSDISARPAGASSGAVSRFNWLPVPLAAARAGEGLLGCEGERERAESRAGPPDGGGGVLGALQVLVTVQPLCAGRSVNTSRRACKDAKATTRALPSLPAHTTQHSSRTGCRNATHPAGSHGWPTGPSSTPTCLSPFLAHRPPPPDCPRSAHQLGAHKGVGRAPMRLRLHSCGRRVRRPHASRPVSQAQQLARPSTPPRPTRHTSSTHVVWCHAPDLAQRRTAAQHCRAGLRPSTIRRRLNTHRAARVLRQCGHFCGGRQDMKLSRHSQPCTY